MSALVVKTLLQAPEPDGGDRQRTATLLDAMPFPLLLCDSAGRPTRWNPLLSELLDTSADVARSGVDGAAVDAIAEALPILVDVCSALLTGQASPRSVVTFRTAAGERDFELDGGLCRDATFAADEVVVALREITAERTLSERLQAAHDEIVQFRYHVSHDLSAPIASARGLLGLIEDDLRSGALEDLPELLEETEAQLTRLQRLIADLMSLARVSGEMQQPEAVDLRDLVDEIVAGIGLHTRELEISVTLSFDSPNLMIDRVRLRQILANLISNARKFQDPEEIAPYIQVSVEDDGDDWLMSVTDNGIGMDRLTAERAFDMFTRGSSAHPGHGLGLHIVLKHVDRLGGSVSVGGLSKPTRIDVRLPKEPHRCATEPERSGSD